MFHENIEGRSSAEDMMKMDSLFLIQAAILIWLIKLLNQLILMFLPQLPLMLETDAFARYYGLEKGQVVKITYRGGAVGALKTYRCIV